MDELEINYQFPYFGLNNAYGIGMSLITFGFNLFANSYLVANKNVLKKICDNYDKNQFLYLYIRNYS